MINFPSSLFPHLTTERLQLNRLSETELPELFVHRSDPKNMNFIHRDPASNADDIKALFDKINNSYNEQEGIAWAIRLKESPALVGTIVYHNLIKEHYRAEIGYMIHHPYWNRGIASEAVRAVMQYGFDSLRLHTIEAVINPSNEASRKVLLRNGFIKEGYFRENYFYKGTFYDSEIFTAFNPAN